MHAGAQGADDCANAVSIAGNGTFAVSTVGSTDSPEQSGVCVIAHHDVWFRWTATQSGGVAFETCGGATVDTVLAVYSSSSCPSPSDLIACNDDSCAFQS